MLKNCCSHNCRQGRDCPLRAPPAQPSTTGEIMSENTRPERRAHAGTVAQAEINRLTAEVARLTAAAPTDLSTRLRESADAVMLQVDRAKLMRSAADEIERYYGGMMAWKKSAKEADARAIEVRATLAAAVPADPPVRTCFVDDHGTTRCSGCRANHDLNQDHGDDCWVADGEVGQPVPQVETTGTEP